MKQSRLKKLPILVAAFAMTVTLSSVYGFANFSFVTKKNLGGTQPSPTIDQQVLSRGPI